MTTKILNIWPNKSSFYIDGYGYIDRTPIAAVPVL